ncbi:MAG TPA: hypothetical protein VHI78_01265 [Bacteroidales bacterium]|nr:hypothetical protein [Bacteroidales bacterium]
MKSAFQTRANMRFSLFIYIILIGFQCVSAQPPEYSHHVGRAFHISSSVSVEISNKYGRVQVVPWDKDSVRFDIDLRIRAKDNQKLEKIRQNIEFEFTPGQYYIIAQTKFGDNGSDVLKDLVDIAGSYISSSNSVSINYTVRIPEHINLKIENKFGDVYLDDHSGALTMILSYGDLKANRLNGRSDLKISSGDADINYFKEGTAIFSYANVHIRESSMLTVQSQSSVITIEKSGNIKLNSRRDKIYLNEANYVSGETYFTTANIGALNNSVTLGGRYGDIIIDDVRRSFTSLNIISELTDVSMSFERPMVFDFDLTHHQSVLFTYPRDLAHFSTNVINAEEKLFVTTGDFGTGSSSSKVTLKALRKCNLTISQR